MKALALEQFAITSAIASGGTAAPASRAAAVVGGILVIGELVLIGGAIGLIYFNCAD